MAITLASPVKGERAQVGTAVKFTGQIQVSTPRTTDKPPSHVEILIDDKYRSAAPVDKNGKFSITRVFSQAGSRSILVTSYVNSVPEEYYRFDLTVVMPPALDLRRLMADIAIAECEREPHEDGPNTGVEIEKYLSPFRQLPDFPKSPDEGFEWCGCFVRYCGVAAGLSLPLRPEAGVGSDERSWTLAYVPKWVVWAKKQGWWHPNEDGFEPSKGDIFIIDGQVHIGIVNGDRQGTIIPTSEGNRSDQAMNATRRVNEIECFIRID